MGFQVLVKMIFLVYTIIRQNIFFTQKKLFQTRACVSSYRSLRQNSFNAEWKKAKKEEDIYQKMYIEPVLQRIFFIRSSV